MLYGKQPCFDHMKVFGYLAYARTTRRSDKFAERGRACVFVGYRHGQKGYKLFDPMTHECFISRDVIFMEFLFPFAQPNSAVPHTSQEQVQSPIHDDDIIPTSLPTNEPPTPVSESTPPAVQDATQSSKSQPPRSDSAVDVRHSTRTRSAPKHLEDYTIDLPLSITHPLVASCTDSPSCNLVRYPLISIHLL